MCCDENKPGWEMVEKVLSKAETLRRKQAIWISGVGTILADEIAD